MKKFSVCLAIVVAVCLMTTGPAAALQFVSDPLDGIKVHDAKLAWELSQNYQMAVSAEQVTYLRSYMGYGEVAMLYGMADATGKPLRDIFLMRKDDNLGWGAIAKELGVKLPDMMDKAAVVLKKVKLDGEEKAFRDKVDQETKEEAKLATPAKDGKPASAKTDSKPAVTKPAPPKKTVSKAD